MKQFAVLGLLWLGLAALSSPLREAHQKYAPARPVVRWEDAWLDVIGEGRTVLARLLWFKMDLIHEQQDDAGVDSFQQKELAPLLRMITYLDPSFVDAYDTLAYELYRGFKDTEQAIRLVDEGLKFNPDSWELLYRRGFLSQRAGRWAEAVDYLVRAVPRAREEIQLAAALRGLYHCAVKLDDVELGLRTLRTMEQAGFDIRLYSEQGRRWHERARKQNKG